MWHPRIFRQLGIKHDSPAKCTRTVYLRTRRSQRVFNSFRKALVASVHCKACVNSKKDCESLWASKNWRRPDKLLPAERTAALPKAVSHGKETQHMWTPVQFQGTNRPLHVWLHMMKGSRKANQHETYEKCMANLRERPHRWSCESAKHPQTMWKAWGYVKDAVRRSALH